MGRGQLVEVGRVEGLQGRALPPSHSVFETKETRPNHAEHRDTGCQLLDVWPSPTSGAVPTSAGRLLLGSALRTSASASASASAQRPAPVLPLPTCLVTFITLNRRGRVGIRDTQYTVRYLDHLLAVPSLRLRPPLHRTNQTRTTPKYIPIPSPPSPHTTHAHACAHTHTPCEAPTALDQACPGLGCGTNGRADTTERSRPSRATGAR